MSGEFDAAQLKLLFIDAFGTPISVRGSCYGSRTHSADGLRGRARRHRGAFWETSDEAQHCAGSGI